MQHFIKSLYIKLSHLGHNKNFRRFNAAGPLMINPKHIKRYSLLDIQIYNKSNFKTLTGIYYKYKYLKRKFVIDCNQGNIQDYENHFKYIFIKELWENELDYTKTKRYNNDLKKMLLGKKVKDNSSKHLIDTKEKLNEYYEKYIELLTSLNTNGYNLEISQDHPLIWISEEGHLIKEARGRHRTAATKVVGIPKIPVYVSAIHVNWINKVLNIKIDNRTLTNSQIKLLRNTIIEKFC